MKIKNVTILYDMFIFSKNLSSMADGLLTEKKSYFTFILRFSKNLKKKLLFGLAIELLKG